MLHDELQPLRPDTPIATRGTRSHWLRWRLGGVKADCIKDARRCVAAAFDRAPEPELGVLEADNA